MFYLKDASVYLSSFWPFWNCSCKVQCKGWFGMFKGFYLKSMCLQKWDNDDARRSCQLSLLGSFPLCISSLHSTSVQFFLLYFFTCRTITVNMSELYNCVYVSFFFLIKSGQSPRPNDFADLMSTIYPTSLSKLVPLSTFTAIVKAFSAVCSVGGDLLELRHSS